MIIARKCSNLIYIYVYRQCCLVHFAANCSNWKMTFRKPVATTWKMNENQFRQMFLNPWHMLSYIWVHFGLWRPIFTVKIGTIPNFANEKGPKRNFCSQVQTKVPSLCFYSVFPIWTKYMLKLTFSFLFVYCMILDWMKRGWFCVSHLCTILRGQSGIAKVIVFFETFSM